jgi:beta-lactam-binding protein with PASTA domain
MARSQDSSFFVAFLTALVVSAGTTVLMHMFVLPRVPGFSHSQSPSHDPNIPVPPVIGLPLTQARAMIQETGFRMKLAGQEHDRSQPAGNILKQSPPAGIRIPKNSEINITVSLGPPTAASPSAFPSPPTFPSPTARNNPTQESPLLGDSVRAPRVTQMNLARAKQIIQQLGLVSSVSYQQDDDISPNWVLSQSPPPGKVVKRGTKIHLVVNKHED